MRKKRNISGSEIDINKQKEPQNSSDGSSSNASNSNNNWSEDNQEQNSVEIGSNTEPTIIVDNVTTKSGEDNGL